MYIYIYFWLLWVFIAVRGLSLVAVSEGLLCCGARASHCGGFSCCGARALGTWASVVAARGLSSCSTWALEHLGFSSCSVWALGRVGFSSCGAWAQ